MNDAPPPMPVPEPGAPGSPDDLAAYALDAHVAEDEPTIAAHLRTTPDAARHERALRSAAGELAAALVEDVPVAAELRARVLGEAHRRRPPAVAVAGASPIEVHRVELSRVLLLLADLAPADWGRPLDPPEFAGWAVHDLAVHLAANEALLAQQLGAPVPGVPETTTDNDGRTAQARARHAAWPPAVAVAELAAAAEAAAGAAAARGEDRLDETFEWWGVRTAVRVALLVRSLESWTHADDVRRAVGAPLAPPPPASLLTMAHMACGFVPLMLAARGVHHRGRLVRIRFADLGAAWDVDLGALTGAGGAGGVRPAGEGPVDAELCTEAVAFCRRSTARIPADAVPRTVTGDDALIASLLDALPALAVL